MTDPTPELSVIVPVRDEAANIEPLVAEIAAALSGRVAYEIVAVDDGSNDDTPRVLARLRVTRPEFTVVRHHTAAGQSMAIVSGVTRARAPVIATLDGDGQNDPADIPALLERFRADPDPTTLMVAGRRARRRDTWRKRMASRIANGVRSRLLGDATPDTGCGLKVFPRALFMSLPRFDHMHRFLPALVLREGGRVVSLDVSHRPRGGGRSKYGVLDRLGAGVVDLFGVMWLMRRARRPVIEETATAPRDDTATRGRTT